MAKKKLLIYAHYYIPDTASTGQILRELAEGMLDKFDITVICVVPSYLGTIEDTYKTQKYYEEEINGVKVLRIRVPEFSKTNKKSRVKNIVSYFFGAMGATFKVGKQDYVFSISQPPILGGLLGVWGKWVKHAKYIYNIQDFNPEQVLAVGYTKSKFITDAMMWFDKFSCKRSDLIITVGRDLVETVEGRFKGKKVPKTVMINNWIDEDEMLDLVAIAQSSPGAIAVNGAIVVGYKLAGIPGTLVAILGTILPPFAIISVISICYNAFRSNFFVAQMLSGMQAGVGAVIASVTYDMGAPIVKEKDPMSLVIMLGAFLAACILEINVIYIVIVCGLLGVVRTLLAKRRAGK